MNWYGDDLHKELITDEGYHLRVTYHSILDGYLWSISRNGKQLRASGSREFRKNLPAAQRSVQQHFARLMQKDE